MHAIILAAGVGERLGTLFGGRPKCLLEMDGRTLLARHFDALNDLGIRTISVVTGFQSTLVDAEVKRLNTGTETKTLFNPDYRSGSIVSLWTARSTLASGRALLLMDADVLCHPDILRALVETREQNCLLIDRAFEPGDEPVKVCVKAGRVVEFRKQIAADIKFDWQGESVGFFRFNADTGIALAERTQRYIDDGRQSEPYEEAIRDLVLGSPDRFGFEDISGLPWIEIDFPGDVDRARHEILPRLSGAVN